MDEDDNIVRNKGRFVAKGYNQEGGRLLVPTIWLSVITKGFIRR